jgi:enoyl-[acyl-carrier protein] reductase III
MLFDTIRSKVNYLSIFVHAAALGAFKSLTDIKPNQWDLTFNTNVRSFVQCVQFCRTLMNGGRVVALSSLGAQRAIPNYGAIGPSKAALEACIRQLAIELAPEGIRVNGVSAGPVMTDSLRKLPEYETLMQEAANRSPAGRVADCRDVADVVVFLTSSKSNWIYGQTIIADGGLSLL